MSEVKASDALADESLDDAAPGLVERARSVVVGARRLLASLLVPDRGMPDAVLRTSAAPALVLVTLCAVLAAGAIGLRLDVSHGVLAAAAAAATPKSGAPATEQPEAKSDREVAEEISKSLAVERVTRVLGAGLGAPARILALAALWFMLLRYVGGKPTLARTLALSANCALPGAVRSLLGAGAALMQTSITPEQAANLVPNPVATAAAGQGLVLERLAAGCDPFALWTLALLLFGAPAAAELSRRRAVITVLVVFALYVAISQFILAGPPPVGPTSSGAST